MRLYRQKWTTLWTTLALWATRGHPAVQLPVGGIVHNCLITLWPEKLTLGDVTKMKTAGSLLGSLNATSQSGVCRCRLPLCHDYINTTNKCVLKDCHELEITENMIGCTNRGARSKETAMYLTIISFTGAQNFYLRNWAQAVPQLIGFLIILISCGGCLWTFGSFCKSNEEWY